MTHTLHPEIEKAMFDTIDSMNLIPFHCDTRYCNWEACKTTMEHVIRKHLGPYLKMPQPIENEPLPEQSTPKIQKIEQLPSLGPILNEYQQHWEFLELRSKVQEVIDNQSKIIDHINNTLPTKL